MKNPTPMPMTVQLLSAPENPLETLYYIWKQSRHNDPIPPPKMMASLRHGTGENISSGNGWEMDPTTDQARDASWCNALKDSSEGRAATLLGCKELNGNSTWLNLRPWQKDFQETVLQLLVEDVPCTENLHFSFAIENMPITLREQLVRHRVAHHFGDRIGADIVPDLVESTWWSQTMRVLDLSDFFSAGKFLLPESVLATHQPCNGETAYDVYMDCLREIEQCYQRLLAMGIPKEDARNLLPLATTHRITWTCNLKNLCHVIGKRSCWISQGGIWHDLISGMVDELATKVDPMFRRIVNPPCISGTNTWKGCPIRMVNQERISGEDGFPPCPLYLHHHREEALERAQGSWTPNPTWWWEGPDENEWATNDTLQEKQMEQGRERFGALWGRNVDTGEPVS